MRAFDDAKMPSRAELYTLFPENAAPTRITKKVRRHYFTAARLRRKDMPLERRFTCEER